MLTKQSSAADRSVHFLAILLLGLRSNLTPENWVGNFNFISTESRNPGNHSPFLLLYLDLYQNKLYRKGGVRHETSLTNRKAHL